MRWQIAIGLVVSLASCTQPASSSGDAGDEQDARTQDDAEAEPPPSLPCGGKPLPRCNPESPGCYEIIPGYGIRVSFVLDHGTATSCAQPPPEYPPIAHQCCTDEDCSGDALCMQGISDASNNFPPNTCQAPGCLSQADCGPDAVCEPPIGYNLSARCNAARCLADADCEPGAICAPTWLDQPPGNHRESFGGVVCIPDPMTCTGATP